MSVFFNSKFYLQNNPDVLQAVVQGIIPSAEAHFNEFGYKEGRNPSQFFDVEFYLINNPDVLAAGMNPLTHFIEFGAAEGRVPFEGFVAFSDFDTAAYAAANPDLAAAGLDTPAELYAHFATYGFSEDRPGVRTVDGSPIEAGVPATAAGNIFTLTTGVDAGSAFVGTDDVASEFNAPLALGIDGLVGVQTLQGPDVLDGGMGGDNVLNAELNGTGTTANPSISNIEVYNLTSLGGFIFGGALLDLSRATGYEQLWNIDSRFNLELINVGEQAIIGMDGVRGGTAYTVEYEGDLAVVDQTVVAQSVGSFATGSAALNIDGTFVDSLELNATASRLSLGADVGIGGTLTINVEGGNTIAFVGNADRATDLVIAGTEGLTLTAAAQFPVLESLDATGYDEDLSLDISGSAILTSVQTGGGDDLIVINGSAMNGDLSVDLGDGMNVLAVDNVFDAEDVSDLDFTGGVQNVQTLDFVDDIELDDAATLDLTGFDGELSTISFDEFDADGFDLSILAAPEELLITASDEFEMDGGLLTIEGVVDLTVQSTGPEGTDTDVRIDGGLESTTLVNLVIDAADDAELEAYQNLDALTTVDVTAQRDDADVEFSLTGAGELAALTTVNVAAAEDADLEMNGIAGAAGVQQQQRFDVTGPAAAAGNVTFNVPGIGNISVAVALGATAATIASDIEAALGGLSAYSAEVVGDNVTVTRVAQGPADPITVGPAPAGVTVVDNPVGTVIGVTPVDGAGFEALETITVEGGSDADLDLTDVYGGFTASVTAAVDADVDLTNTGATSLLVEAGTDADVDIDGALFGNPDLTTVEVTAGADADVTLADSSGVVTMMVEAGMAFEYDDPAAPTAFNFINEATIDVSGVHNDFVSLTVSGASADITLAGELASFATLDLTGVALEVSLDASVAEYSGAVTYLIGATANEIDQAHVEIVAGDVGAGFQTREVFSFVGDDIGNVVIENFDISPVAAIRDALDFSAFAGITGAANLAFTDVGADLVIEAADGQFEGSITLVGLAGDEVFVSQFSTIYT